MVGEGNSIAVKNVASTTEKDELYNKPWTFLKANDRGVLEIAQSLEMLPLIVEGYKMLPLPVS